MNGDSPDSFFQELDSEDLLKEHGHSLVHQARLFLAANPDMRIAGLIALRDSEEARPLLEALPAGQRQPDALRTLVARRGFEAALIKRWGTQPWLEEPGQPQQVLPVVVATRDGHRFGFFDLRDRDARASGAGSHPL